MQVSKWQVWVFEGEIIIAEVAIKAVDQSMVERRSNSFLEKSIKVRRIYAGLRIFKIGLDNSAFKENGNE